MEFVHPERLWFLFFLLIPIVIHLFHFRKRKTLYFSSLRFIQFLEKEQQSTRKLKHLLVLLTRILALSAIIFAFAQPQATKSASPKQQKWIRKLPQNYPQHPDDTQTTKFLDMPKHHLIQNSQKMGRNGPVEADIHHFWGCKISMAKTIETNSKTIKV